MSLLIQLNCLQEQPLPEITVLTTIVNLFRLLEYAFLLFLILFNQRFRMKFKHLLRGIFQREAGVRAMQGLREKFEMEDVFFDENLLELK